MMKICCYFLEDAADAAKDLAAYIDKTPGLKFLRLEMAPAEIPYKRDYFYVQGNGKGKFIRIKTDDVFYLESAGNYTKINLADKLYVTHAVLKEMQEVLPDHFKRVHKSFMVNMDKVETVEGNMISLSNKVKIDLGPNYQKDFFDYIFPVK